LEIVWSRSDYWFVTEYVQFCVVVTGGSDSAVAPFVANLTPGGVAERYSLQYTVTPYVAMYLDCKYNITVIFQ